MILRIYKKNNINRLIDITNQIEQIEQIDNKTIIIQRYLNLIKKTENDISEVYTEQTELLYENKDYIVVSYKKILQQNNLFPNLKVYSYDKNIKYCETIVNIDTVTDIQINKIKLIKESIQFLEIELNDDNDNFRESYSIETLLNQIKQQILDHK